MNTEVNVNDLEEVYAYVEYLEGSLIVKELDAMSLTAENKKLRRSVAAFKANSTRRNTRRQTESSTTINA